MERPADGRGDPEVIHLFRACLTVNGFLLFTAAPAFVWGMAACRACAKRYWS